MLFDKDEINFLIYRNDILNLIRFYYLEGF